MDEKRKQELKNKWLEEENISHIKGWDFSHINNRYEEENKLPWNYESIIKKYLHNDMKLLDYDTGGGEFLLSLNHPYDNTYATEGFKPNVKYCESIFNSLGVHFKECSDCNNIPFDNDFFDIIINRHGDFSPKEMYRLLKKDGLFITQQVGENNDRDLVEFVLPEVEKPFPGLNLENQKKLFIKAGFEVIEAGEYYGPIKFYDVGAFVWFARIIEWEFPGFTVNKCFNKLLELQKQIDEKGYIEGTIHRYMLVLKKG